MVEEATAAPFSSIQRDTNETKKKKNWTTESRIEEQNQQEQGEIQTRFHRKTIPKGNMHSFGYRANALVTFAVTILVIMCAMASFSDNFNSPSPTASVQVHHSFSPCSLFILFGSFFLFFLMLDLWLGRLGFCSDFWESLNFVCILFVLIVFCGF